MNEPGRFGPFLLFQETESHPYRSCYRAGITRGRAVERVVRLEVFDRAEFDPTELAASLEVSRQIQASLRDPHIATGAGLGQVGAIPYTAYDFELGTTLAVFSKAARERKFPIPLDQALFIAERVALALAAAYRVEIEGQPRLHSFLTPDSVLLSNVGEVKVCGFETARSLRLALHAEPYYASYLSPQCREGQPRHAQDDVFSLGSLLFELVTGLPLPAASPDLDTIVVQATGEAAPPGLQTLLQSSLAAPAQRLSHVLDWQRGLSKLILDGEYNPTTFNLAFLMHTLLRESLERGVESLEQEKRFVLPQHSEPRLEATLDESAAGAVLHSSDPEPREETVARPEFLDGTGSFETDRVASRASSTDRKPFWIGFSLSAITASALLGGVLLLGNGDQSAPAGPLKLEPVASSDRIGPLTPPGPADQPAQAASAEVAASFTPPVRTALVLTEVVQGQLGQLGQPVDPDEIERAVAERTSEIERSLAAEYDQKLEALRAEMIAMRALEDRATEALTESRMAEPDSPTVEPIQDRATGAEIGDLTLPSAPAETPARPPRGTQPVASTPAAILAPIRTAAQGDLDDAGAPGLDVATQPPKSAEIPEQRQLPVESPAQLLRLKAPLYPAAAKRLGLSATARIRVVVSTEGEVLEAEILGPELGSGFDRAALSAARRSKWIPATRAGEPVESTSLVTLQFQP